MKNYLQNRNNHLEHVTLFDALDDFFRPVFADESDYLKSNISETENDYRLDVAVPGFSKGGNVLFITTIQCEQRIGYILFLKHLIGFRHVIVGGEKDERMAVGHLYELANLVKSSVSVRIRILYTGHVIRQIQKTVMLIVEGGINDKFIYHTVNMIESHLPSETAETLVDSQCA